MGRGEGRKGGREEGRKGGREEGRKGGREGGGGGGGGGGGWRRRLHARPGTAGSGRSAEGSRGLSTARRFASAWPKRSRRSSSLWLLWPPSSREWSLWAPRSSSCHQRWRPHAEWCTTLRWAGVKVGASATASCMSSAGRPRRGGGNAGRPLGTASDGLKVKAVTVCDYLSRSSRSSGRRKMKGMRSRESKTRRPGRRTL